MASPLFAVLRTKLCVPGTKNSYIIRLLSSEVVQSERSRESRCRTLEDNPMNHTWEHEGRFYTVPQSVCNQLFKYGGVTTIYQTLSNTFGEMCFMVRKPALEVINCMRHADYSKPVMRYVLYGGSGCGKSLSLSHILHYGFNSGHLLFHIPWVSSWTRRCKDHCNSEIHKDFRDTPIDSAAWLVHFKTQNQHLLSGKELTVSEKYVWSRREETLPGATLLELIELGINRIKYASSIIVVLASEVMKLSSEGRCKTMVVIDGYNAFFNDFARMVDENVVPIKTSQLTVTKAFMNLTKYNWTNGSVVVSVDKFVWAPDDKNDSDMPFYQLGKKGFEHLDPFVPINVQKYTEKEFHSCIDYYVDQNWIQTEKGNTEEGRNELLYLSVGNPFDVMKLCAPL